jgi:L-threonylcarbamoyladenylate synthase
MELINIQEKNALEQSIEFLKKGKVLVLPTDTIYGFSCIADNLKAIEKIKKIKKRKKSSFIILISSLEMIKQYCYLNTEQKNLIKKYLKKKSIYSFVLKAKSKQDPYPNNASLALRLPKSDFLIKIIKRINKPIISTSFNLHNQELVHIKNAENFFKKKRLKPDLILTKNNYKKTNASKIIDIRYNEIIRLR